jgi:Leucine-rich repeat (LRR) protein
MKTFIYACITIFLIGMGARIHAMEEEKPSGVSIAHLLATNEMPCIKDDGTLDLECRNISSLSGLETVPRQQEILGLNLSHNLLRTLPSSLFPNLTYIDISHNELKRLPAGMLEGLVLLKHFFACSAKIEEFPPHFFDGLPRLTVIDASNNLLSNLHPELFSQVTALKRLSLTRNKLSELSPLSLMHQSKLTSLRLAQNELTVIPTQLCCSLQRLETLDLNGNELVSFTPGCFDMLGQIKGILLANNKLTHLHPELFRYCTNLIELNLGHNQLTTIPHTLLNPLTTLRSVNLRGNHSEIVKNLPKETRDLIQKNEIFIGDPKLLFDGDWQANTVKDLIEQLTAEDRLDEIFYEMPDNLGNFTINLAHRGLKNIDGLNELLPYPERVINIYACNNYLEEMPCNVLNKFRRLRTLDLHNNRIHSLGQSKPFEVDGPATTQLQTLCLPKLTILLLAHNQIQSIPYAALARLTRLSGLQLSHNKLEYIEADAFKNLENLESCLLNNNKLGGIPAHLFASRKTKLHKLEFIDLSRNRLGSSNQYSFPPVTTVRYLPQSAQPLQIVAAKQIINLLKQMAPHEKLALMLKLPRNILASIAPKSISCYLILCNQINSCGRAFDTQDELKSPHSTQNPHRAWIQAISCLDSLQWDEGILLFLAHFDSNPQHQKLLYRFCAEKIQEFEETTLIKLAHTLITMSPTLRNLITDQADRNLQIRMAQAIDVYNHYLELTRSWMKRVQAIFLAHMKKGLEEESPRKRTKLIENEWSQIIEAFRERYNSWTSEMQSAIIELLSAKCKRDLAKHGIVF